MSIKQGQTSGSARSCRHERDEYHLAQQCLKAPCSGRVLSLFLSVGKTRQRCGKAGEFQRLRLGEPEMGERSLLFSLFAGNCAETSSLWTGTSATFPLHRTQTACGDVGRTSRSPPAACHFSLMQKCLRTGFSIFQVPLKPGSTTKASPGRSVTGAAPSGVMVIWPSIIWTNS